MVIRVLFALASLYTLHIDALLEQQNATASTSKEISKTRSSGVSGDSVKCRHLNTNNVENTMSKRPFNEELLTKYLMEKMRKLQEDIDRRQENLQPHDMVETNLEDKDEDFPLPSTSNGASRNQADGQPKNSNFKKDILNMLPKANIDEDVDKIGEDITAELAASWKHLLANGLDVVEKKALETKHPTPRNCPMINAPELNPPLKNVVPDTIMRKDLELQNKQKQIATSITCISKALTKLIDKGQEEDRDVIKVLVDAGQLLCDFQYNESVARRNAAIMKFCKDLKILLLETKIDTLLFGENWKKNLTKQVEDLAIKKQMDHEIQSMMSNQAYLNVDVD